MSNKDNKGNPVRPMTTYEFLMAVTRIHSKLTQEEQSRPLGIVDTSGPSVFDVKVYTDDLFRVIITTT